jgi:hypothetical protein
MLRFRSILIVAMLMAGMVPAIAQDSNPFSGARSIEVTMARECNCQRGGRIRRSHHTIIRQAAKPSIKPVAMPMYH